MNGALPLLRTLEPTVRKSCSRIPHIVAHIRQRRARALHTPRRQLRNSVQTAQLSQVGSAQHAFTVAFGGREDADVGEERKPAKESWWAELTGSSLNGTEASQHQALLSNSDQLSMQAYIDEAHPERVLHAFRHPRIGPPFIRSASDQDFAHAFELLDPLHFLDERKKLDRAIQPKLYIRFKIRTAGYLGHKFDWYLQCLEDIISQRRQSGHPLTLEIYRHLLTWAEVMGAESLARDIFDTTMPQEGITPDLLSYNNYLGACIWNGAYDIDFRYKRRNAGINFLVRERVLVPKSSSEMLSLKRSRYERLPGETVRGHALSVFGELTNRGHKPNEATFVNLILAMGYNRDIDGVKSVLKSVWNIDVDMLGRYDEEEIESSTYYDEHDPLRPTPRLLHAIVYVFGTNNDPFHASFLLDYISRNYNIQIPNDIWMLVFEFTYILAQKFSPGNVRQGLAVGKLPEDALVKYTETINDEPHNVKSSTWMLQKLANNARRARNDLEATLEAFKAAVVLRDEQMTLVSRLYDDMLATCSNLGHDSSYIPPVQFLNLRRTYVHEALKLDRDLESLRTEWRNTLADSWQFNTTPWHHDEWAVRTIPHLIQQYPTFLPEKVTVRAPNFVYTIENGKWHRERAISDTNGQFDVKAARLRNILEEEEARPLLHKARHAAKFIDMTQKTCFVCKKKGEHHSDDCPRWEVGLAGYGLKYGEEALTFVDHLQLEPHPAHKKLLVDDPDRDQTHGQGQFWKPPLAAEAKGSAVPP